MTLPKTGTKELTKEEWDELNALREAINYYPHTVSPSKMEKFTELFVRSLEGKEDNTPYLNKKNVKSTMTNQEHNSAFDNPIEKLEEYEPAIADRRKRHYPGTPFEEYCSLNPDADECRVYDD